MSCSKDHLFSSLGKEYLAWIVLPHQVFNIRVSSIELCFGMAVNWKMYRLCMAAVLRPVYSFNGGIRLVICPYGKCLRE